VVATFCLGGLAIKGDFRLMSCTSSVNRARRQAASPSVGVTLLGVGVPSVISSAMPGCPTRDGVSYGSPCGDNIGESDTHRAAAGERMSTMDASTS
jgi:hypothetical protein